MTEHIRLLSMSRHFLNAANALASRGGESYHFPVPHYLAGHAIELALKAHLAHKGASENRLKKLGHDLEKVLRRTDASVRAVLTDEQVTAIKWLNQYYAAKELEYTAWGASGRMISIPRVSYLIEAATNLVNHLDSVFRAERRARGSGGKP